MVVQPTLVLKQEHHEEGTKWSAWDIEKLALALNDGGEIEGTAYFPCRAGTVEEICQKAKE